MKVLVLSSRIPFPLEKGDKLRLHHQIKHLHTSDEVVLCCLSDRAMTETQREALAASASEVHVVRLSQVRRAWRMLWAWASSLPFQVI